MTTRGSARVWAWAVLLYTTATVPAAGGREHDWRRVATFADGEHRALGADEFPGVARFLCRGGAWEQPWVEVVARHADRWGGVTLRLKQKSPLAAPHDHDLEVTWRQPAAASPCLRDEDLGGGEQLLHVQLWDGHGSEVLSAVDDHWPFATAFKVLAHQYPPDGEERDSSCASPETAAELMVCPGCAVEPFLWPPLQDACYRVRMAPESSRFLAHRLCPSVWEKGAGGPVVLNPVERFYAVTWQRYHPGISLAAAERIGQHMSAALAVSEPATVTDPVFLTLVACYLILPPASRLSPPDHLRALRLAVRLSQEAARTNAQHAGAAAPLPGSADVSSPTDTAVSTSHVPPAAAPSPAPPAPPAQSWLTAEALAGLAQHLAAHGLHVESFLSLAKATSDLAPFAVEGPLINAAVGISRMVLYTPGTDAVLLQRASRHLLALLAATEWGATVSVEIMPMMRARLLTEALVMGGCFGGDGFTGSVQLADPSDQALVHARILNLLPYGADLGERASERLVLLDVGANTGCFSLMALDPPALRVLAFEPIAATHRTLREHVRLNGLEARVTTFHMAASNRSGSAVMCDMSTIGSSGMSAMVEGGAGGGDAECSSTQEVQLRRLDAVCEDEGIERVHFIKIDAERSELAVLQGAERLLVRDRPEIFVEVSDVGEELGGSGPVTQYLAQFGYLPGEAYGPNLLFVPRSDFD